MSVDQMVFLVILAVSLYLFVSERLRVDVIGLLIILSLSIFGILDPVEAFAGFSSEPALIVAAVFVLSAGLSATGLTDAIGDQVGRFAGTRLWTANLVVMMVTAALSAFTHHLMVTAMMLPIAMRLCREHDFPTSRVLIPMATASSLGTTMTLIGAPAFLLGNGIIQRAGEPSLNLFSLTSIGATLVGVGFILILLMLWILPKTSGKDPTDDKFRIESVFTELVLTEGSKWIGTSLSKFKDSTSKQFELVGLKREGQRISTLDPDVTLKQQDVVLVKVSPDELASVAEKTGLALRTLRQYGRRVEEMGPDQAMIVQALISPHSQMIGRTVGQIDFLRTLGVLVIGLWRRDGWIYHEIAKVRLREGDLVILWGTEERFHELQNNLNFLLLMPMELKPKKRDKAKVAASVMIGSVLLAATNTLPPHMAFLLGALMMVLTGCISMRKAYESIEVKIFVMIAGVIPLGVALEKTGLAGMFADALARYILAWEPLYILLMFFSAAALLTQILSDAATTVLIGPVAAAFAKEASLSPTAAVVCVAIGAVASFLTPIGHHGNLLILGPGNYRFIDFLKIGFPLTAAIAFITCHMALQIWG